MIKMMIKVWIAISVLVSASTALSVPIIIGVERVAGTPAAIVVGGALITLASRALSKFLPLLPQ